MGEVARRPLKSRNSQWARAIAQFLAARGARPNWISLASVVFAAAGGGSLLLSSSLQGAGQGVCYLAAAVAIQMRLLCNLFDGMVAIEGGLQTKSGEIFNDMPDRLADALLLIPVGYALSPAYASGVMLGWLAGMLAIFTAYIRVLGGACGLPQRFTGPMAKQHRMAVLTGSLVLAASMVPFGYQRGVLLVVLVVVIAGCVITIIRRTRDIIHALERT